MPLFFTEPATPEIYTLSLHDALPISANPDAGARGAPLVGTRFVQDFGEAKVSALFNKMKRDMPSGQPGTLTDQEYLDRKSTRLNSSHLVISYAVFCLKKKNKTIHISQ